MVAKYLEGLRIKSIEFSLTKDLLDKKVKQFQFILKLVLQVYIPIIGVDKRIWMCNVE